MPKKPRQSQSKSPDIGYGESFDAIYSKGLWGRKGGGSGRGSELSNILPACIALARFIDDRNIERIVDLSCGAMAWWPTVISLARTDIQFVGADVSAVVIEKNTERLKSYRNMTFVNADALTWDIPECDLLVCRETLNHLPMGDALAIAKRMLGAACRFAALTQNAFVEENTPDQDREAKVGTALKYTEWNFSKAPFHLPPPEFEIPDERGRTLALYRSAAQDA